MGIINEIKIAFVGAGYMTSEHLRAFSAINGVKPVGIHSRTENKAKDLESHYPTLQIYDSIESLYETSKADIVVVSVNELSMSEVAIECFKHPWLVLLEKPAGYDLADASKIVEAADELKARAYVALNRRAYSSTRIAISRLNDIDAPRFIKVVDQQDQQAALTIYNEPQEVADNYMFANSIHLIDYFHVLGRGTVTAVESVIPWDPRNPGMVVAKISFASGDVGLYEGIWNGPGPWGVSVSTPQERIELKPLESITVQEHGQRVVNQLEIDARDVDFKPGLRFQAEQAVNLIKGVESSLPTVQDSFISMKLVAKIFGLKTD